MNINPQIDGLRVALEMERRGRSLYLRAQQYTDNAALKELLAMLASDEARHHAQFSAMLDIFEVPVLDEESNALAAAKVADFFFPGGLMQMAMEGALTSCDALLEEAMSTEQDSINFYETLMSYVDNEDTKAILSVIIDEEKGHFEVLKERKKNL